MRPLHAAADRGDDARVRSLISDGADVMARDILGQTSLQVAVWSRHWSVARLLAREMDRVASQNGYGAIHSALATKDVTLARLLVENGADVERRDAAGQLPLQVAVRLGSESTVNLLTREMDIAARARSETSAFHAALARADSEVACLLITHGADLKLADSSGQRLLQLAHRTGLPDVARLLAKRIDVFSKSRAEATALHNAAMTGNLEFAQLLVRYGADTPAVDSWGQTPLHVAASGGHEDVASLLIAAGGATVGVRDRLRRTALHLAVMTRQVGVVRLLLENGADVGVENQDGKTARGVADDKGYREVVKVLEGHRETDKVDNRGWIALHEAARSGNEESVAALLNGLARPPAVDIFGRTPLHEAANRGSVAVVKLLLDSGAPASIPNVSGITPLHEAASRGHSQIAHLLINAGASTSTQDAFGFTPLHSAAENGYESVARLLVKKGADPEDLGTHTPQYWATVRGHIAVEHFLREFNREPVSARRQPEPSPKWSGAENASDIGRSQKLLKGVDEGKLSMGFAALVMRSS